jgi:general transcription factor IIIA
MDHDYQKRKTKKCCVPGCTDNISTRHRFPKDPELFQEWKNNVNNPALKDLSVTKVYNLYYICNRHFSKNCLVVGTKRGLTRTAVPTLHLGEGSDEITLPKRGAESLQTIEDFELLSNLSLYDPDLPRTIPLPMSDIRCKSENGYVIVEPEIENISKTDDSESQNLFVNERGSDMLELELEPQIYSQLFDNIDGEYLNNHSSNITREALVEKPYFKSVKSYLLDSNCISEVCRICFRSLNNEEIIQLYGETTQQDTTQLKDMLKVVLPDLDLEIYPETVLCTKCTELLAYSYQLKKTWLVTEEKLKKLVEQKKGLTNREADLIIVAKPVESSEKKTNHASGGQECEEGSMTAEKTDGDESAVIDLLLHKLQTRDQKLPVETSVFYGELKKGEVSIKPLSAVRRKKKYRVSHARPYMCEKCGVTYKVLRALKRHVQNHSRPSKSRRKVQQRMMCELCGQFFLNSHRLQVHYNIHKSHECATCHKVFSHNFQLQQHIRHRHLKQYNRVQCHLCGKQLSSRASFNGHMLSHKAKKSHQCNICDMRFHFPSKLKLHLRRHCADKIHSCEYCGKAIKYEKHLKQHIKIYHMNLGKFVCEFCNRPYWKNVDLVKHKIKVHRWTPQKFRTDSLSEN